MKHHPCFKSRTLEAANSRQLTTRFSFSPPVPPSPLRANSQTNHECNHSDYELHEALDFRPKRGQFCLFSIQFSPDNTHILGGGSDNHVYLYSLERLVGGAPVVLASLAVL